MKRKIHQYKILRKILRISFLSVVAIIIGVNIYSWNAKKILGDAMPMPTGYGIAVVLSGSMESTLSINDLIIVKEMEKYKTGDIVVYQKDYELIVHRIVSINNEKVITRGDANTANDEAISINDIKGKVINFIPYIGIITNFIKSPLGMLLIISLLIYMYIYSDLKEKRRKELELIELRKEIELLKGN